MRVVNYQLVTTYSKYKFTALNKDNSSKPKDKDNKFLNNSFVISGALALAALGGYILTRNSKVNNNIIKSNNSNNEKIIKTNIIEKSDNLKKKVVLTNEKIANSLPKDLKEMLSVENKYDYFKNSLLSQKDLKIAGVGANSIVYNLDFLDDYVLKILKKKKKFDPNQIPIGLFPEDINLGQPIWKHPDDNSILILKKVSGIPNSIKNWSNVIFDDNIKMPHCVTSEQAQVYFDKISKISSMDQKVFDDLAYQIKVLDSTSKFDGDKIPGFKIDSVNPNNLLVDFEKNKLSVIDYFAKNNSAYQNSYMDMLAVISDFTLYPEYYDRLNQSQRVELVNCLNVIEDKSYKAAQKVGLSTDKTIFLNYINKMNKYFPIPSVKKSDNEVYVRSYDIRALDLVEKFNKH